MGRQDTWKKSAAARRDARATKTPDAPKPVAGKKDTKRWCKGKVGVEHKLFVYPYREYMVGEGSERRNAFSTWRTLACSECGKQMEHYFAFAPERRNQPEWLTKYPEAKTKLEAK